MEPEPKTCRECGYVNPLTARTCQLCGEGLSSGVAVATGPGLLLSFVVGSALVALLCVVTGIAAAVVVPGAKQINMGANEREAIEALRGIAGAQRRFHGEDLDGNGVADYGSLGQLGTAALLEPDLASGLQDGYVFDVWPSEQSPQERWMAVALPMVTGKTGDRSYAVNQTGAVYLIPQEGPFDRVQCEMPPDARPLGGRTD